MTHTTKTILLLFISVWGVVPLSGQGHLPGISIHEEGATDPAYRLYNSRNLEVAHLINPKGRYLHSWAYNQGQSWHYAEMLPNGHLIAIIKDQQVIELDWNSQLVWKAEVRAHHDFARKKNGNTLVLSRKTLADPWGSGRQLSLDRILEFDRNGRYKSTWNYEAHEKELAAFVNLPTQTRSQFKDWPHLNTLEVLPVNPSGDKDKRFREGNLLICGRHANFIAILHRSNGKVLWAWGTEELQGPHMPTMLPNGNILIYDNGHHSDQQSRGYSRVIELNPITEQIIWEYTASPKESFFSPARGSAERLPNGNTLISDSDNGRLFEVTKEGKTVWEYLNPDKRADGSLQAFYRTVPYTSDEVDPLLQQHGLVPDFTQKEWKEINRKSLDQIQYKRLNRESISQIEVGYLDDAHKFGLSLLDSFPDDEEGLFVMSLLHSRRHNLPEAMKYVKLAAEKGFQLERYAIDLEGVLKPLIQSEAFQEFARRQDLSPITHGPMLGAVTDRSARIWLRANGPQQISIHIKDEAGKMIEHSALFSPASEEDYVYEFPIEGLEPNQVYMYEIWVKHQQIGPSHSFRTAVSKGTATAFTLGFGGGAGFTPWNERVWDTLSTYGPEVFLAMGDNVYIDHPERPMTQRFCYFRRQSRPEYRRFIATTAQYAIWDDHDFTYNDSRGGPAKDQPYWKRDVLKIFQQNWVNPAYGGGETDPGIWHSFSRGDVDIFMLDCRYYRENPAAPSASMLGPVQKQWLKDQLLGSTATFKIIASSVPWAKDTKPGSKDTWDGHPEEREEIFNWIEENKIEGVVLVSADRHRSDAWKIQRPNGYPLYEFMSSRLTNMHVHKVMPGSLFGYNQKQSFGLLEFDTTVKDPQLVYRIISIDNEEIHRMTVYRSQLLFPSKKQKKKK
ncbi:MAG: alkaline phosphatase D family protein [Bacteroidota bacterium]